MKFTKTIRWRLLSWFALLLGAMLVALDFCAYEIHLANRIRLVDDALQRSVATLSSAISKPPRPAEPGGGFGGPPDSFGGFRGNKPPPDGAAPGSRPSRSDQPPQRFAVSGKPLMEEEQMAAAIKSLEPPGLDDFYYCIWRNDAGGPLRSSTNCPDDISRPSPRKKDAGTHIRTRGIFRETYQFTGGKDCVLAGCSLVAELKEAREFAWLFGLGSLAILAVGLGGASLIITHALRPVKKISDAAMKISSGDLAQRINVAETESELGQLAAVLNSTFARLDAAFTRQKQFTSAAAHELRTPVTVMLTHTQNGLAAACDNAEHREAFEACQRAALRMKKLIGALLALARLDDGRDTTRRSRFDLAASVQECVALVEPMAAERRIKIVTRLTPVTVTGDAEQIMQVIMNLVINAIQYNHIGGDVCIGLTAENGRCLLTVADTGPGIAHEDLPRVFERFYRGDKSRSSDGLGLGLAIAQALISVHDGTLTVASEPGRGAIFTATLPLAAERT